MFRNIWFRNFKLWKQHLQKKVFENILVKWTGTTARHCQEWVICFDFTGSVSDSLTSLLMGLRKARRRQGFGIQQDVSPYIWFVSGCWSGRVEHICAFLLLQLLSSCSSLFNFPGTPAYFLNSNFCLSLPLCLTSTVSQPVLIHFSLSQVSLSWLWVSS